MRNICGATTVLALLLTTQLRAESPRLDNPRVAQLSTGSADWRQWDGFLTTVVKKLGEDLPEPARDQLRELFLDSRYQLVETAFSGVANPVPSLITDTWTRLSPILNQATSSLPADVATRYRGFITTMDGVAALSGVGQRLGLVQVTPDMLRGASRLLGIGTSDPLAYVLDVDSGLRTFLGFTGTLPNPRVSPALGQGSLGSIGRGLASRRATTPTWWLVPPALAAGDEFERLNQWMPQAPELDAYLIEVRKLLGQATAVAVGKTKLAPQYHTLFQQITYTAAWQESCWRQFVKKGNSLAPLASATGDVGMMQVNRHTWRGLYDLNGLAGDVEYNANAGSEILLYYLSRFAIPKHEDKQPGGQLARATYSAYNGGPRQLARYRTASTIPALKKVDEAFWTKFRAVSAGQELAVKSCYGS
jgi:hypothetical protein